MIGMFHVHKLPSHAATLQAGRFRWLVEAREMQTCLGDSFDDMDIPKMCISTSSRILKSHLFHEDREDPEVPAWGEASIKPQHRQRRHRRGGEISRAVVSTYGTLEMAVISVSTHLRRCGL